jgi:hypothetical protein
MLRCLDLVGPQVAHHFEENPRQRQRNELQARLDRVENTLPSLSLRFTDADGAPNRTRLFFPRPLPTLEGPILRWVERHRQRFPPIPESAVRPEPPPRQSPRYLTKEDLLNVRPPAERGVTQARRESYNSSLEHISRSVSASGAPDGSIRTGCGIVCDS